jgi:uncharacterized membrane protein
MEMAEKMNPGGNHQMMILIMGPVFGAIMGLILGLFAWIASKMLKEQAA